jgi:hypothetical protein
LTAGGSSWAGTGDYYVFFEGNSGNLVAKSGYNNFVNGSATLSASNFEVMGLVITNINSSLYGSYKVYVNSNSSESTYRNTGLVASSTVSIQRSVVRIDLATRNSSARWTGSGSHYVFLEDTAGNLKAKSGPVSFTNGNGTVSSFTEITGRLTISSLNSGLYGTSYRVYVNSSYDESTYKITPAASSTSVYINSTPITVQLTSGGSPWPGSGSYYVFLEDSGGNLAAKSSSQVSFTNGNGSVSSFTEITGRLIITGIDPGSYQVYVHATTIDTTDPTAYIKNPEASSENIPISQAEARINLKTLGGGSWNGTGSYYVFLENTDTTTLVGQTQVSFIRGRASVSFSDFK